MRVWRFGAGLAVLAGLAGCAGQPPAPPPAVVSAQDVTGVIVAIRPLPPAPGSKVLTALGTQPAAATPGTSEFILRDPTGRTLSVVQANPGQLRLHDRVRLAGTGHSRLVRLDG